jgi:hypothetical protein
MLWKKKQEDIKTVQTEDGKEKGQITTYKQSTYVPLLLITAFVTTAKGTVCKVVDERLLCCLSSFRKYLTGLSCRDLLSYVYRFTSVNI